MAGSVFNDICGKFLADKSGFYAAGSCGFQGRACNHDAGRCAGAIVVERDNRGAASDRVVRSLIRQLRIRTTGVGWWNSETKLGDDFIRLVVLSQTCRQRNRRL